ncbi:hypothetical protein Tco_1274247 [Tanacetum coccineum]
MTTPRPTPFPATTLRTGVLVPFVIISDSDDKITTLPIRPAPPSSDRILALHGYPLDSGNDSLDEDLSETAESLHTQTASTSVIPSLPSPPLPLLPSSSSPSSSLLPSLSYKRSKSPSPSPPPSVSPSPLPSPPLVVLSPSSEVVIPEIQPRSPLLDFAGW